MSAKGKPGIALAILAGASPKKRGGSDEEMDENSGNDDALESACDDIISAIHDSDPKALSEALESWMTHYKSDEA